jgi:hypothetical protein
VLDTRVEVALPADLVTGVEVQAGGVGLRAERESPHAVLARPRLGLAQHVRRDALAPRGGVDRHAPQMGGRAMGQQPAGRDDLAVAQRDEVDGLVVAPVDLQFDGDVLLAHEHGVPDGHRRGALRVVAGLAHLDHPSACFSMSAARPSASR